MNDVQKDSAGNPIHKQYLTGLVLQAEVRAVALGYEHSVAALQNADSHHCLHSCPHFGEIAPHAAVTRKGYVLFGADFPTLARELHARIST